jgi:tRNA1(Val) A37 N6-methylase TrmN6
MLLYQPKNGYCYNSDTHFLFNFICQNLKIYKNIQGELLDIGSGSGILGLLVARDFNKLNLNQVEIQKEFIFLSNKNSSINNQVNIIYEGDFISIKFNKKFDYIVSNPPFYPNNAVQSENKNKKIARYNDNLPLYSFLNTISQILSSNGKVFFCYDVKLLNDIMLYCNELKLNIEALQFLYPNINKEATLVMVMIKKNSKTLMKIIKPAIMFGKNNIFTKHTINIYKLCSIHSVKCNI